jgi:hypothetical protein
MAISLNKQLVWGRGCNHMCDAAIQVAPARWTREDALYQHFLFLATIGHG